MEKPTIIYYEILNYRPQNMELLRDNFQVITLPDPSYDTLEVLSMADVALAPLGYSFDKEKIDKSPRLKAIGSNTTGHPHIDVDYAKEKQIKVITLKDYQEFLDSITPTAEMAWGLIIAVTRNIIPAFNSVLNGKWDRWSFGGQKMLSRMSLGIAGLGRLGRKVASYGISFGMKVNYFDPYIDQGGQEIKRSESLEELVESNDIITVHIPHEPETEDLFNKDVFNRFKKGSFFINTSRAELIDQDALLEVLKSGRLAGAATDVLEGEFEPGFGMNVLDSPMVGYAAENNNLIITPHIGGSTTDAWTLTQEHTIRKLIEKMGL